MLNNEALRIFLISQFNFRLIAEKFASRNQNSF
nr:MAG TPA: hypothetical protein [Caudoviricetes sp.]